MNARGEFVFSMLWLIKPKIYNNNQYYADNHLIIICISIPKDSIAAGREIKNNSNIHFPRATGSGLGCLQVSTPLSRSILVESL
jgi:hypothetical protein